MKHVSRQAGFTIPELVAVIVVVLVAIALSLVFIHPRNYDVSNRNAERLLGLAHISQALTRYYKDHGSLPDGITEVPAVIGNADPTGLDLCLDLVPSYLKDMPLDPTAGAKLALDTCLNTEEKPSVYTSGYTILQQKDGTVVLEAPATEAKERLRLTHQY